MNVFVLDLDIRNIAEYYSDDHLESGCKDVAQILCSVYHKLSNTTFEVVGVYMDEEHINNVLDFKKKIPLRFLNDGNVHINWAFESYRNFDWLCVLGCALSDEYRKRYHKVHESTEVIRWACQNASKIEHLFPKTGFSCPPKVVPDLYRVDGDKMHNVVLSYRSYYINEGHCTRFDFKDIQMPDWINNFKQYFSSPLING